MLAILPQVYQMSLPSCFSPKQQCQCFGVEEGWCRHLPTTMYNWLSVSSPKSAILYPPAYHLQWLLLKCITIGPPCLQIRKWTSLYNLSAAIWWRKRHCKWEYLFASFYRNENWESIMREIVTWPTTWVSEPKNLLSLRTSFPAFFSRWIAPTCVPVARFPRQRHHIVQLTLFILNK